MIKTNTDLLKLSLRKLGELSTIEGGDTWLMLPPGGINSHPSLAAAVSSIEDPASVIDHSMQGMRTRQSTLFMHHLAFSTSPLLTSSINVVFLNLTNL